MNSEGVAFALQTKDTSLVVYEDDERQFVLLTRLKPPEGESLDELCQRLDRDWKRDFIGWLRRGRSIRQAAELAGKTPRHARRCREQDPLFAQAWTLASESRS